MAQKLKGPNWPQRFDAPADYPDVANGVNGVPQRWAIFLNRARQTLTLTGMANWVYDAFYGGWLPTNPDDMHMSAQDLATRYNGPANPAMLAEDPSFVQIYFAEAVKWLHGGHPFPVYPWDSFGVNSDFYAVDMCNFTLDDPQQQLP